MVIVRAEVEVLLTITWITCPAVIVPLIANDPAAEILQVTTLDVTGTALIALVA